MTGTGEPGAGLRGSAGLRSEKPSERKGGRTTPRGARAPAVPPGRGDPQVPTSVPIGRPPPPHPQGRRSWRRIRRRRVLSPLYSCGPEREHLSQTGSFRLRETPARTPPVGPWRSGTSPLSPLTVRGAWGPFLLCPSNPPGASPYTDCRPQPRALHPILGSRLSLVPSTTCGHCLTTLPPGGQLSGQPRSL